ncbi:MAG: hypothetical protein NZ560_03705 [Aquificaceae bacterium]|nr:hypothetical protein [Aquificaceae bacterium]MDW8097413.1 hypothetical protein [Aquificaceae bacterium]
MLRDIGLVFFVYRALVCFFLVALSFDKPVTQKALLIIPFALYISLSMYVFLFPGKLRLFKNYGDVFFLPLIALLSGQREALFALLPPVAMYTSRDLFRGMLFTWLSVGLALYYYGLAGLALAPVLLALFFSSLHPDLVEALRKERFYVKNLRKSHAKLLRDYGKLQRDFHHVLQRAQLVEVLQESTNLQEYLQALKELFQLKAVSVTPAGEDTSEDPILNKAGGVLSVPVKLARGWVYVNFFFHSPLEVYDERKIQDLEKAGRLINLFITAHEERPQVKAVAL